MATPVACSTLFRSSQGTPSLRNLTTVLFVLLSQHTFESEDKPTRRSRLMQYSARWCCGYPDPSSASDGLLHQRRNDRTTGTAAYCFRPKFSFLFLFPGIDGFNVILIMTLLKIMSFSCEAQQLNPACKYSKLVSHIYTSSGSAVAISLKKSAS